MLSRKFPQIHLVIPAIDFRCRGLELLVEKKNTFQIGMRIFQITGVLNLFFFYESPRHRFSLTPRAIDKINTTPNKSQNHQAKHNEKLQVIIKHDWSRYIIVQVKTIRKTSTALLPLFTSMIHPPPNNCYSNKTPRVAFAFAISSFSTAEHTAPSLTKTGHLEALGLIDTTNGGVKFDPVNAENAAAAVDRISAGVAEHYLLRHDFLQCFSEGEFGDSMVATNIFARNHYTYSKNFIRYLTMVKDKLSDERSRHLIMENMEEENGNYEEDDLSTLASHGVNKNLISGIPHKVLIKHFLSVVGVTEEMLSVEDNNSPGGAFTKYMLDLYEKSNACEALAVIGFSIEQTVPQLYQFILDGLKRGPMDPDDYVFFPLHILVDDGHADLLKGAFAREWARDPAQCANAESLVFEVLDRRTKMLSEVRTLTEAATGRTCTHDRA